MQSECGEQAESAGGVADAYIVGLQMPAHGVFQQIVFILSFSRMQDEYSCLFPVRTSLPKPPSNYRKLSLQPEDTYTSFTDRSTDHPDDAFVPNPRLTSSGEQCIPKRNRRQSFIELGQSRKTKVNRMIRNDYKNTEGGLEVLEEEDETTVCSSMIYVRSEGQWKNRELINLTTRNFHKRPIESIKKIKVRREEPLIGYKMLRLSCGTEVDEMAIAKSHLASWFANTIWLHLVTNGYELAPLNDEREDEEMESKIYKKSEILGKWEPRQARINRKEGFSSYKRGQQKSPSLVIRETMEVWSRFQIVNMEGVGWVVFKIWFKMFKEEIAVRAEEAAQWASCLAYLVI